MLEDEKRCTVCGGKIEEGYILDIIQNIFFNITVAQHKPPRWVKGKLEKTMWGNIAFSDRPNFYMGAFRCENCGHLEFYATGEPFK